MRLGENVCRTPEEFKAWSQNLGHEHVLTTFTSYGAVSRQRQAEIMRDLQNPQTSTEAEDDRLRKIVEEVYRVQGKAR